MVPAGARKGEMVAAVTLRPHKLKTRSLLAFSGWPGTVLLGAKSRTRSAGTTFQEPKLEPALQFSAERALNTLRSLPAPQESSKRTAGTARRIGAANRNQTELNWGCPAFCADSKVVSTNP